VYREVKFRRLNPVSISAVITLLKFAVGMASHSPMEFSLVQSYCAKVNLAVLPVLLSFPIDFGQTSLKCLESVLMRVVRLCCLQRMELLDRLLTTIQNW
jgi:hypothetical protein